LRTSIRLHALLGVCALAIIFASVGIGIALTSGGLSPGADGRTLADLTRLLLVVASALGVLIVTHAAVWMMAGQLIHKYDRLSHLYRTGQALQSTLDLTHVLEQLARDAAVSGHADLAIATIVEEETDDLIVGASYDAKADATSQHHRKVEEWYMRRCAATGEVVEAEQDSLPYEHLLGYELRRQGAVALLCAPIPGRNRSLGVLMVVRGRGKGKFRRGEAKMVEEMASHAAMAVEQATLFAKMRKYADQVEGSYDTTLKVLIAALDQKDAATHGHSERVSRLAVTLAREMGIADDHLVDIERGALLHDVGKIGVPDDVLRKPEDLDEAEWEAMRKHPLLAGLMVSKVEFLEGALPILLYHHERYDGTGYPFGLEGKNIPIEARIFSVVDTYDAMTSSRPYRDALPHIVAMGEIQQHAGSQFDPEVVVAFTRVMERDGRELREDLKVA
jgi:response regulator RpfG family c-di-GMP phosphodiesterase